MTDIPEGVLHGTDRRSNLISADESPPPILPRNRNEFEENPIMTIVNLQHRDNFKYATRSKLDRSVELLYKPSYSILVG